MYEFLALAIYSRSPSAYHAVRSLGILNLPCDRTLKGHMYQHSRSPGISEDALLLRAQQYNSYKEERVKNGLPRPVAEGVLIWDEVKVQFQSTLIVIIYYVTQVQSRLIWNSSNSSILGYAMSSEDFISFHDVYDGISEDERCQKTMYMLQFLWRDLSSDFNVVGPYIHEMDEKDDIFCNSHLLTAEYLQACNMMFENGILSHERSLVLHQRHCETWKKV